MRSFSGKRPFYRRREILHVDDGQSVIAGMEQRPGPLLLQSTINDKASRRRTMPIVNIQITREGTLPEYTHVTREQKAQLIEGVSKLLLDVLNKPMNSTFVVIDEVDIENWGWGGLPVEEYRKLMATSAHLPDIDPVSIAKD